MIQFFSKNFFSKIFPTRYFQKTSDGTQNATVPLTGIELDTDTNSFIIDASRVTRETSTYLSSGGPRRTSCEIKLSPTFLLLSYTGKVKVETTKIWDTEEDIIELLSIILQLTDIDIINTPEINLYDDDEDISYILSLLNF